QTSKLKSHTSYLVPRTSYLVPHTSKGTPCPMQTIAQNLTFGLFVGSIYGVAAAGLALVFGVLKMLNVAHGELLMIGGYITFWLFTLWGVYPFVSLLISIPGLFLIGLALDRLVFRFLVPLPAETKLKNS